MNAVRIFRRFFKSWAGVSIAILFAAAIFWYNACFPRFSAPCSLALFDTHGELIGASVAADEQWRFAPGARIPQAFVHCITAIEDKRFFYHPGIDPLALARAFRDNLRARRIVSGASTITMQTIRLSRPGKPRSLAEKVIEAFMALRLELSCSKNEILALYAAHAPFGGNVVGLEAAAWRWFGRGPDKLSWAEHAMLASLPNNPSMIHPGKNRALLRKKRNRLLERLYAQGVMDSLTCALAKEENIPSRPKSLPNGAPHLLVRIKNSLARKTPDAGSFRHGGRVSTTLDKRLQQRVRGVAARHGRSLSANHIHNAAILIIRISDAAVKAYVGNTGDTEARHGNYVDIVTAPRSTGSILKPILYGCMLDDGLLLPTQLVADIPTRIGGFAPQNYSLAYRGAVPAADALARSLNVPAVRMLNDYGVDRFYDKLRTCGMRTLFRPAREYGLSLILGGAEGTLWEIAGMYARMARKLLVHAGDEFEENRTGINFFKEGRKEESLSAFPISSAACWNTLEAMATVHRPESQLGWEHFVSSRKIAWKTGTSYGFRDAWAIGLTPRWLVAVWVGNADGEGRPGLTGIDAAAPLMFDIWDLLEPADAWFLPPEALLSDIEICAQSGFRAGRHCGKRAVVQAPRTGLQAPRCPWCRTIHCDASEKVRLHSDCAPVTSMKAVSWMALPPAIEWYYRQNHASYRPLPPWREDCRTDQGPNGESSMTLMHPHANARIYIPRELDSRRGKTVFQAAHRNRRAVIHWHLDGRYLGATKDIHQMPAAPEPGKHTLTLVDEDGELFQREFDILAKD